MVNLAFIRILVWLFVFNTHQLEEINFLKGSLLGFKSRCFGPPKFLTFVVRLFMDPSFCLQYFSVVDSM